MQSNKLINTRQHFYKLSDGRDLCWFESGPITGFPVIFCTGAGMSGLLGFGIDLLEKLHIRLIVPERAGLGESTQDPQKSFLRYAADIEQLLKSQHITHYSVVGFSQGAVFAMALAFYGKPKSLVIASGQDQFDYPTTAALLKSDVLNLQKQAIETPDELSNWLQKNVTAAWLLAFILHYSAQVDQQIYNEETFLEAYTDCVYRAFDQGNWGYIQDLLISFQQWPFSPEEIYCPVSLWYGQQDTSTVHSPDFGKTLATRFPNCKHYLFADEGGSLLWTQAERILASLQPK
ncbi:alpha/beta fold hydrolase [Providencia sneebia]|uniref:Hydrolase n=1 Tax=Providencia sneebia DSM 19967 TaxID=1141660 RepID=K8W5Z5_9GAMM|nr:hydrolase [Providencia sneebia DSM 19967]